MAERLDYRKGKGVCRINEIESKLRKLPADSDMLAQLPEPILQEILLLLPTADAARMSLVSKSLLRIWSSLPGFLFFFRKEFNRDSYKKNVKEFMAWADGCLSTLRSQEGKALIRSFALDLKFAKQGYIWLVRGETITVIKTYINDCISMCLKNCLKELKLSISGINYTVPGTIFAAKSLLKLHIEYCSFRADYALSSCLKELTLSRVNASSCSNEKMLSYSPLLEKFILREIVRLEFLKICNLPRLNYVEVEQTLEHSLEIVAPNLHTLRLSGEQVRVCVSDCFKAEDSLSGEQVQGNFVFGHPSLETLHFCFSRCLRIRVLCARLKIISLSNKCYEKPLDVEVDAPKLEQFNYEGYGIPSIYGLTSSIKPHALVNLSIGGLDVGMRNFWARFNQPIVHLRYHYGQFFRAQKLLLLGQVEETIVNSVLPRVKALRWSFHFFTPSNVYPYLLDGSLCSCHPDILVVETLPNHKGFIQFLCHELFNREGQLSCCLGEPQNRCWKHYLEDVTTDIYFLSDSEKPKTFQSSNLMEALNYVDTAKEFHFRLEWSEVETHLFLGK